MVPALSHAARGPVEAHRRPLTRRRDPGSPAAAIGTLGLLDTAARARATATLQGLAGNRATADAARQVVQREPGSWAVPPNPYAIKTRGGGAAAPEIAANPFVEESDPVTLANPRFIGQPRLARIARGEATLSAADDGPAMRAVQEALIALGFEMVRHAHDGHFGAETREAIGLFRARRGMTGDAMTARALGELDRAAPPPGVQEEHYYDYERLFGDGYLDVTVAVGYDEGGGAWHQPQLEQLHQWLRQRGFEQLPAEPGRPEQHRLRRQVTYPTRAGNRITREIVVRLGVIAPGAGAAQQYGRALSESEITIYNGHARRGIGPDFDDAQSAKENFIIGLGSALHAAGRAVEPTRVEQDHYVIDRVNDLEQMVRRGEFDQERYRIWFFNACTTLAYQDELRSGLLPAGMDRGNLDLMLTGKPAPLLTEMTATLAMVDGILAAGTIEGITRAMNQAGEDVVRAIPETEISAGDRRELLGWTRGLNVHEGAGDNPVAARP